MTRTKPLALIATVAGFFAVATGSSAQLVHAQRGAASAVGSPSTQQPLNPPAEVGTTAWSILTSTADSLAATTGSNRATSRRLADATSHLRMALRPALWSEPIGDGNHLDVRTGRKVFDHAGKSVAAMTIIRGASAYLASAVTIHIAHVAYSTRLLATTAVTDNSCTPLRPKTLDIARRLLARGDAEFARTHPALAVAHYGNAWWHAMQAAGSMCATSPKPFAIGGSVTDALYPGASRPIDLVLTNPNDVPITVQSVVTTVDPATSKLGCDGRTNLVVTRNLVGAVTVPGATARSLSQLGIPQDRWPVVTMPDLPTNQDACQATTFTVHYSGTATG